ncbi:hypothetical protein DQ181_09660 [Enterococcus faecium]|nr:hypothetical protein [Enterococcus faecium]
MASSGVGQFSINVKSNLKSFYGDLVKAKSTMKDLTDKKNQLQIDSSQLDKLRDKSQRISAEMRELRQQKTEIKLGMKDVENADAELKNIDQKIASLNRQKLEVDAEIQPIRTANVELFKVEQEIDKLNGKKVEIDVGEISGKIGEGLDNLSSKVMGVVKAIGAISFSGLTAGVGILKEAVNAASDLEQNTGGVQKLFGDEVAPEIMKKADSAYKTAGMSKNDYLEQATSYSATLITSLDGDKKKAAEYVDKAITDMSDNSNTFGTDVGSVQHAYEGIMKNNYTMIDNLKLGFKATQEGAIEAVNTYGNLDEKITDISQVTAPMMIDAIHNAQEAQNIAGTTAKEAATTYEGSLKMMKGAWENFLSDGNAEGLEVAIPIYLDNLDKKLQDLTPKIIKGIKKMVKVLPEKLKPVIKDIQKILTESIDSIFGEGTVDNFVKGMKPFTDIIKKAFEMLSKSTDGKKTDLSWVGSVIPDLLKLAIGLKTASGIFKGISFAQKIGLKLPSFSGLSGFGKSTKEFKAVGIDDLKKLGMKMLTIAGISANIYLAAKALQQVQKVGDLGDLQPKMLAIAEAVVGMGLLATAVGFINEKKPDMLLSGLTTIALISSNIWLAGKALQEVGEIDSDFGSIQSKIVQIALSIAEIGTLAVAIGLVTGTGIGAGALIAGLLAILGIAGTLFLTAKSLESIANMELDGEKVKGSIQTIKTAIEDIGTMAFDGNPFKKISEFISSIVDLGIVLAIIGIGKSLEQIQNLEIDSKAVEEKINTIKISLESISDFGFDGAPFEKLGELLSSLIELGLITSVVGIGNQLMKIQELELDEKIIAGNIKIIKDSLFEIGNFGFDGSAFEKLGELFNSVMELGIVSSVIGIGKQLTEIQDLELDEKVVKINIKTIKDTISEIADFGFDESVFEKLGELLNSFISKGIINNILDIGRSMTDIQELELDDKKIKGNVKTIKELIDTISSGSIVDVVKNFLSDGLKAGDLSQSEAVFAELKKIGDVLVTIQGLDIAEKSVTEKINIIKNAIESISSFATDDIVNNLTGLANALDIIISKLTSKFPPKFNELGQLLAKKMNDGFRNKINLQNILSDKIRNLSTAGAGTAGTKIANAINASFKDNLSIGDTIRNSINSALAENYSTKINVELVTTEIKKTTTSKSKAKKTKNTKAGGGLVSVPSGHRAEIQDSPEKPLLDNGEYVIPKKIVSALGVPFFEKIRSGQISRTFSGLAQSVSNTTSSVVNNVYNNNNTQNLNLYASGNQDFVLQANRRFRMA